MTADPIVSFAMSEDEHAIKASKGAKGEGKKRAASPPQKATVRSKLVVTAVKKLEEVRKGPTGKGSKQKENGLFDEWIELDQVGAATWSTEFFAAGGDEEYLRKAAQGYTRCAPRAAATWAASLASPFVRDIALCEVFENWSGRDLCGAAVVASRVPHGVPHAGQPLHRRRLCQTRPALRARLHGPFLPKQRSKSFYRNDSPNLCPGQHTRGRRLAGQPASIAADRWLHESGHGNVDWPRVIAHGPLVDRTAEAGATKQIDHLRRRAVGQSRYRWPCCLWIGSLSDNRTRSKSPKPRLDGRRSCPCRPVGRGGHCRSRHAKITLCR